MFDLLSIIYCFCYEQKVGDNAVQQHRLRCVVAPSDAKDEEFSGLAGGSAATMKLLQNVAPQLEKLLNSQEKLCKQVKRLWILVLALAFLAFAVPSYVLYSFPLDRQVCGSLSS